MTIEELVFADPIAGLRRKDTSYIIQTLLERRRILAKYWLNKVDALSEFSIRLAMNGLVLAFRDLMVDCKLAAGTMSPPVTIEFEWSPTRGAPSSERISRG